MAGIVPQHKTDLAAAHRAVALGWPGVEPQIAELLVWIQDGNWPVAGILAPFFADVGLPLARYLWPIMEGDDEIWRYWVISDVLDYTSDDLFDEFAPLLRRIAREPTARERTEELDEVAAEALSRRSRDDR